MRKKQLHLWLKGEKMNGKEPLWTNSFIRIWFVNFSIYVWMFVLTPVFPFYIKNLGGTEMTVGLAAGGYALASILMRPFAGWILDNRSRSVLLKFGIIGLVLITLLFLTAPVLSLVFILRIISGFVFSGLTTSSNTNVTDIIPKSRFGEGMAFLGLGNTLSSALGPVLGLLIMAHFGFGASFLAAAILVMVAFMATIGLGFKKIEHSDESAPCRRFVLSNLFNKATLPASVLALCTSTVYSGLITFIALYSQISGLGISALYFLLIAVGTGSSRIFSGHLTDKKGEQPNIIVGSIGLMLGLLLLLFVNNITFYLSGLFFGLGFGFVNPALQTMAVRTVPPEKRGSASSTYLVLVDIGSGLGGFVAGLLVTIWGYRPMFGSMTIFIVILWLIYVLWASKTPQAFKNYKGAT